MNYIQTRKTLDIMIEKEFTTEDDVTKVIINVDLRPFKTGLDLEILNDIVVNLVEKENLSSYKVYNDPNGLLIIGKP